MEILIGVHFMLSVLVFILLCCAAANEFEYDLPGTEFRKWYTITIFEIVVAIIFMPTVLIFLLCVLVVYLWQQAENLTWMQPFNTKKRRGLK